MIDIGIYRTAGNQPYFAQRGQLRQSIPQPRRAGRAVDLARASEQASAELALLVGENHARAGTSGRKCRRNSRGPATGNQHVAMRVSLVVRCRIRLLRCPAESRNFPDGVLVVFPKALRPHEGLVIEAGRQQAREQTARGHRIPLDAGPAIDTSGDQPVDQLHLGRARVRHRVFAFAELHNRIRLVHATGDDAAWTVVFPAAPDQRHAVGEQGRGERIAGEPSMETAVEPEGEGLAAVDAPAFLEAIRLMQRSTPLRAHRSGRRA